MAQRITTLVEMTDDLDGGKADQTVRFSYDGVEYEIDLSRKNATALTRALKPYVDGARKVRGTRSRAKARRSVNRPELSEIRAWAKSNGYQVSDRGRLPGNVMAAFNSK
jgi:hypothetical protein